MNLNYIDPQKNLKSQNLRKKESFILEELV